MRLQFGMLVGLLLMFGLHAAPAASDDGEAQAVLAGGCFWCMQPPYDDVDGVLGTEVGFTGGHVEDPTYQEVVQGGTGHYEAVRITYDPERIGYEEILEIFWRNIDPLDGGGQFCDRGDHYRAAIFAANDAERSAAEASKEALEDSGIAIEDGTLRLSEPD